MYSKESVRVLRPRARDSLGKVVAVAELVNPHTHTHTHTHTVPHEGS